MISEPFGSTKPEAGVIATSPATAPEMMPSTLGFPLIDHSTNIQVNAAVAVAIWVTAIAIPALPLAATADPALNRSEEHTSELQSLRHLVCRLLLGKKKKIIHK